MASMLFEDVAVFTSSSVNIFSKASCLAFAKDIPAFRFSVVCLHISSSFCVKV